MKILAIGAHFDDLELGCGGSLLRWISEGHEVTGLIVTESGYKNESGQDIRSTESAQREGREAAAAAGYKLLEGPFASFDLSPGDRLNSFLLATINEEKPDLLLTHWASDTHTDHRAIGVSTLHCARRVPRVLTYRSNWYPSDRAFQPTFYVDVCSFLQRQSDLIKLYESEVARTQGKWLSWIESRARENGLVIGTEFAEAFEVVKWVY